MSERRNLLPILAGLFGLLLVAGFVVIFVLLQPAGEPQATETPTPPPLAQATQPGSTPSPAETPQPLPTQADNLWRQIQARGRLIVGTAADYPPFEFYTPDFRLDGLDIALIEDIGRRMGLEVEIKNFAFDGLGGALLLGHIDVAISAITVTPERQAVVDFSNVYLASEDAVLAPSGSDVSVSSVDDLAGYRVGVQDGTVFQSWLESELVDTGKMPAENLISYQFSEQGVDYLGDGSVDLVVVDLPPAELAAATGRFAIVAQGLNPQLFAIALPRGATQLREQINTALETLQGEGVVDELIGSYLGLEPEDIVPVPTPNPVVPTPTPPAVVVPPCIDGMTYVANLTFPDEDMTNPPVLAPGEPFQQRWRVLNAGTCTWDSAYRLTYVAGNSPQAQMGGSSVAVERSVAPGQEYDFSVALVAPLSSGVYQAFWEMRDANDASFGERVWVGISVPAAPTPTAQPTQTPSPGISFTGRPTFIRAGECATLNWETEGVQAVYLYEQGQPWQPNGVAGTGTRVVCPPVTTTYELRVVKPDGSAETRQVRISVQPVTGAPNITRFTLDPPFEIFAGQCVAIRWDVEGSVSSVALTRNDQVLWQNAPLSGSLQDCPANPADYSYTLEATGPGGVSRLVRYLRVTQPATALPPTATPLPVATPIANLPVVHFFDVAPVRLAASQCATISWSVGGGATDIELLRDGLVVLDNAPFGGRVQDCPADSGNLVYRIEARNPLGELATAEASVTVSP